MNLSILWFLLIATLYTGFFFLEGFDFGVGMLLPVLGKKDEERRAIINTIGPHWDGNEVWLITAGGATFAAFPNWYATLFSGFYLGMFLLLLALITRGVAFEFRSKIASSKWRAGWDYAFAVSSFLAAFLLGVVFTNLVKGVPIDAHMQYIGSFFNLLNPMSLLGGFSVIAIFLLHGANFLSLKLTDDLQKKARNAASFLWYLSFVFFGGLIVYFALAANAFSYKGWTAFLLPGLAALALIISKICLRARKDGGAFVTTGLAIVFTIASYFFALFPNVMISSIDANFNLTIANASSSPYTLKVMSIVALIFVPVVLAYQIWSYIVFRKRVKADPKTLIY